MSDKFGVSFTEEVAALLTATITVNTYRLAVARFLPNNGAPDIVN